MTYVITRNNRRYGNKQFDSYEPARNYIRKLVRSGKVAGADRAFVNTRNNRIPINHLGFSVKRRPCSTQA